MSLPIVNITDIFQNEMMPIKQSYLGPNLHYHPLSKRIVIKCQRLMDLLNKTITSPPVWPPLEQMPEELKSEFLLDGLSILERDYSYLLQNGNTKPYKWDAETISRFQDAPNTCGPFYHVPVCDIAMKKYKHLIEGKRGMVIGTMDPWAEAWLLKMGASHITTLEYHEIVTDNPQLSSLHPSQLHEHYKKNILYDFIFSFSSLEHNGLGKWGDPINPYGDLEDFARCHCMLKEGGHMFLGIPVGRDTVVWNAHRIYGRYRLSLVLKNWKLIDYIATPGCGLNENNGLQPFNNMETPGRWADQPIIMLQKLSDSMEH